MSNLPEKQQLLIQTGRTLFYKYGIRRVSVEEICRESKVSKVTFYKYFRNKTALVKHILTDMYNDAWDKYESIMQSKRGYPEKVRDIIELKRTMTESMSAAFYRELLQNPDPEISALITGEQKKSLERSISDLRQAQRDGHIRADIKPEFLQYLLNHLLEMAADDRLRGLYRSPQALVNELISFFFYGILNGPGDE